MNLSARAVVRLVSSIFVVGIALAVYLGTVKLDSHGHYNCVHNTFGCDTFQWYWSPGRAIC